MSLDDLVSVIGSSHNGAPLVEFLLERADRIPAADSGRECTRALTDAEVNLLLAGDGPEGAA